MNQKKYWLEFNKFTKQSENIYTPKFNAVLRSQINDYIKSGTISAIDSDKVYAQLLQLYVNVGVKWARISGKAITESVKKARQPFGQSQEIIQFIRSQYGVDLLNTSRNITQTTIDQIRAVLNKGQEDGLSFDQMVSILKSPSLTATRARLISRTETISASNAASVANAKSLNIELKKFWISALDNRTRMDHRHLNGQTVDMNDLFKIKDSLTGEVVQFSHPGDRLHGAGPGQVCNCRCAVGFK